MYYKVYICKPLQKRSNQGLHLQQLVKKKDGETIETRPFGRTKGIDASGNSLPEIIKAERTADRTKYDIGLSEVINNPFKELDVDKILSQYNLDPLLWRAPLGKIVTQDTIAKQTWGEIRFGLVPDELTERVPVKPTKDNPDTRTRIMKKNVVLYDEPNPFCEDNLEGWLSIQILLHAKKRVATSEESANTATQGWVIIEQSVEQKLSIDATLTQNRAIAKLSMLSDRFPITNVLEENILYFIGANILDNKFKPLLKGKVQPVVISEKLDSFLKPKDKGDILQNVEAFNKSVDLYEKTPDQFFASYLARQAFNVSILQQNNAQWFWRSQKDKLDNIENYKFNSFDAFVNFLYNEMIKIESPLFDEFLDELRKNNVVIPLQFTKEVTKSKK